MLSQIFEDCITAQFSPNTLSVCVVYFYSPPSFFSTDRFTRNEGDLNFSNIEELIAQRANCEPAGLHPDDLDQVLNRLITDTDTLMIYDFLKCECQPIKEK